MKNLKRLLFVKEFECKQFVTTIYTYPIIDGDKEFNIVTNKSNGLQDLYEVFYLGSNGENKVLSLVCEGVTNRELLKTLYYKFKIII